MTIAQERADKELRVARGVANDLTMESERVMLWHGTNTFKKGEPLRTVMRRYTVEEAKELRRGDWVWIPYQRFSDGLIVKQWKVTSVKTWKKAVNAGRVEVGLKYGLYEYHKLEARQDGTIEAYREVGKYD
ncbi:MAG TPA: hypothetical protein VF077_06220 [Nitrospiraceae bacterium]